MKVLIIEDVAICQRILKRLLGDYAECDTFANGKDGLQAFIEANQSNNPYDVIFLDVMMPGLNGFDILQKIRKIDPKSEKVKIIMATSVVDSRNVSKAIKYGCDGYIIKPYKKEEIEKQLEKLGLV